MTSAGARKGVVQRSGESRERGDRASARDRHVHIESVGTGPPVVLLHGFAMHGGLFAPVLPALAERHRVHVVDLPGHGWSAPVAPYDLPTLAATIDDATADIDAPVTLLGWSLGGQVALQLALARPARVQRLILVASTPSFVAREDWPHAMAPATLARFGDELRVAYRPTLRRFLSLQVQGSDAGRRALAQLRGSLFERGEPSPHVLAAALTLLHEADLRPLLANVAVPALVIAGERDTLVPLAATQALAAAMPYGIHVPIADAAHAPFLSHPAALIEALEAFADG